MQIIKNWYRRGIILRRVHGPHPSPEKQFQSMNIFTKSHDQAIKLKDKNHSLLFFRIKWIFFIKTWVPFTQRCIAPSLIKIGPVVLGNTIFRFRWYIFAISLSSLLGKGRGPSFKQTWFSVTQVCFLSSVVENDVVVMEKIFKKNYYVIFSPWKRAGLFIWTDMTYNHTRFLCAKFGWKWSSGYGEELF